MKRMKKKKLSDLIECETLDLLSKIKILYGVSSVLSQIFTRDRYSEDLDILSFEIDDLYFCFYTSDVENILEKDIDILNSSKKSFSLLQYFETVKKLGIILGKLFNEECDSSLINIFFNNELNLAHLLFKALSIDNYADRMLFEEICILLEDNLFGLSAHDYYDFLNYTSFYTKITLLELLLSYDFFFSNIDSNLFYFHIGFLCYAYGKEKICSEYLKLGANLSETYSYIFLLYLFGTRSCIAYDSYTEDEMKEQLKWMDVDKSTIYYYMIPNNKNINNHFKEPIHKQIDSNAFNPIQKNIGKFYNLYSGPVIDDDFGMFGKRDRLIEQQTYQNTNISSTTNHFIQEILIKYLNLQLETTELIVAQEEREVQMQFTDIVDRIKDAHLQLFHFIQGCFYYKGYYYKINKRLALEHLTISAELGYKSAQLVLSIIYSIDQEFIDGRKAIYYLDIIIDKLSHDELFIAILIYIHFKQEDKVKTRVINRYVTF